MDKGLKAFEDLTSNYPGNYSENYQIVLNALKALNIIVKKANIRLVIMNGRYYFKTTNNLYEISLEKYKILLEAIYD